jgi:cob(I)alamin adenosyltransferase
MDNRLKGLVQLYAGEGEETYLAPLGMGLRAWGHGLKSCLLIYEIEMALLETVTPILTNCKAWLDVIDLRRKEKSESNIYLETMDVIRRTEYDIIMLGGFTNLLPCDTFYQKLFAELIKEKKQETELVFIGGLPPAEYLDYFALITKIEEI